MLFNLIFFKFWISYCLFNFNYIFILLMSYFLFYLIVLFCIYFIFYLLVYFEATATKN